MEDQVRRHDSARRGGEAHCQGNFEALWNVARSTWRAQQATSTSAMAPATDPSLSTSASGGSTKDDKVPKTLPAGVWTKAIQHYESQQIGGCDRTFPTNELLGAESVLARIHHEVTVSKLFTPVQLGEILQKRTFQASGEPNVLAKKESKSTTFTVSNDQLVASEEQVWQPRSLLAILDGLSSIRCWAYILLQVGPEKSVHSFFDWAIKLARSRPQKPDQLNQWWVTVSWKLALELRGGKTWEEAAGPLQRDYDTFTECMGREPVHIVKPPKTGGKSNTESNPKGKGKYKQPRPQPYGKPSKGGYQQEYYNPKSQSSSWTSCNNSQSSWQQDQRSSWNNDQWDQGWSRPKK